LIHKCSCNHSGGILDPDECIMNFINKKNEEKVFVGTNDEDLRNELRNLGTVPIFFFKRQVLVMDTPSDAFTDKMALKELMKLEPTI
jgi:rRNA-processing protein FCF1